MLEDESRIFRRSKAKTMYISVPSSIVNDSKFPFSQNGQNIKIQIKGDSLVILPEDS
jgi:hypothetical protein